LSSKCVGFVCKCDLSRPKTTMRIAQRTKVGSSFFRSTTLVTFDHANAARAAATLVADDARVHAVVLVSLVLLSLALILSTGAEWLRAT
jgi:hypothetical protein